MSESPADFQEVLSVNVQGPLSQGDVIEHVDERVSGRVAGYVIVTADCDLAHNKFGGKLTALPLVTLADYVCDFWLQRQLSIAKAELVGRLGGEMEALIESSPSDLPRPNSDRLTAWPLSAPDGEIERVLSLPSADLAGIRELRDHIRSIDAAADGSLLAKWRACSRALTGTGMKSVEKASASLAKRVSKELPGGLPGDVMYLHRPFGGTESGFVALARFPETIVPGAVGLEPSDEVYGGADFRRIGRLDAPYRYRLTQLFAEIYSAIGLPDEYEQARNQQFSEFAEEVGNAVNW